MTPKEEQEKKKKEKKKHQTGSQHRGARINWKKLNI